MMSVVLRLLLACLFLPLAGCSEEEQAPPSAAPNAPEVESGNEVSTIDDDPPKELEESVTGKGGSSPSVSLFGDVHTSPNVSVEDPNLPAVSNEGPITGESSHIEDLAGNSAVDPENTADTSAVDLESTADTSGVNLESEPEDQSNIDEIKQVIEQLVDGEKNTASIMFKLLLVILAGLVAQLVAKATLARFLLLDKSHQVLERKLLKAVGLASAGFVWSQVLQWELVGLRGSNFEFLINASRVFFVLAATLAGFRSVDALGVWATKRAGKTESSLDDILVPLGRKALKLLVVAFGLVNFAPLFGLEITPLLGALGVGGIGFAFAAQNTIENLFGSVTVVLDRPFSVGDWVEVDGVDGIVEEVGLRSTKVRTFYNSLVSIPNAKLTTAIVDNYGSRKYRRFKATLGVRYETTPEQIEAFCKGIKTLVADRSDTRKDVCYAELNGFGDSSLNIMLYMFFECEDWTAELRGRHELMLDIIRLAHELGVEFAFPTQIVHLAEQALPMARPESFGAVNTLEAAGHLGEAKAKEIGGRGA